MPNKNNPGCGCCCKNTPMFFDDCEDLDNPKVYAGDTSDFRVVEKDGGNVWRVSGGIGAGQIRKQWQVVDIPNSENLRIMVKADVFDNETNDGEIVGIFVGGVARMAWITAGIALGGIHNFRGSLTYPVDGEGNPYPSSTTIDLGYVTYYKSLEIVAENDWTNLAHMFGFGHGGGTEIGGSVYAFEISGSGIGTGSQVNIGMLGSAGMRIDNFSIVRNRNGNNKCQNCDGCNKADIVKAYELSVPEMGDGHCVCSELSGDYILRYRLYYNKRILAFDVSCGWATDDFCVCGDGAPIDNAQGNCWFLHNSDGYFKLESSNARNMLRYICPVSDFVCGEAVTFVLDESFFDLDEPTCTGAPATLTIIPRDEP